MKTILVNIKKLVQTEKEGVLYKSGKEMSEINAIENAFLILEGEDILDFGSMDELISNDKKGNVKIIDCTGKFVMPAFCDSHTHLVYAGSREMEYLDKIKGLSYEEIAKKGGGILNSAKLLNQTSEEELYIQSIERVKEIMRKGTGAVEIKSGYGLNLEAEMKMLRVIRRIRENFPLIVKSTFLGAHAVPLEFKGKQGKYVDLIINEMIPRIADEKLADFIDVFCDRGFFSPEETARILEKGGEYGLIPKIHANELDYSQGIQTGVKYHALSVDHLEYTSKNEIDCLLESKTMPTILPGASFFLEMPYAPAREMIGSGLPVALASDFNPGSSPSGDMGFIMSLGLIKLHLSTEELINATTLNTAYAMGLSHETGTISKGKLANIIVTKKIPSLDFIPYAYTSDFIDFVILRGKLIQS